MDVAVGTSVSCRVKSAVFVSRKASRMPVRLRLPYGAQLACSCSFSVIGTSSLGSNDDDGE